MLIELEKGVYEASKYEEGKCVKKDLWRHKEQYCKEHEPKIESK
jgi:hypothetical protein